MISSRGIGIVWPEVVVLQKAHTLVSHCHGTKNRGVLRSQRIWYGMRPLPLHFCKPFEEEQEDALVWQLGLR